MKGAFYIILAFLAFAHSAKAQNECKNIGDLQVFYDPTCAQGGPGCNAGGQGPLCRFCGFDIFPKCPTVTESTKPTASTASTTKTTKTTVTRTTNPNPVTGVYPTDDPGLPLEFNEYGERLIFKDEFDFLDMKKWKHDLTMSGGGNWEFQLYHNNRSNSFVQDGVLFIKPTLTENRIGRENLNGNNYVMDMWGGSPVDQCTGNNFYGCSRTAGAGGNMLNPIQSAKLTTVNSFSFKYGRVEIVAKLPRGDWLWPALWMLPAGNAYGMWPASGEIDIMESRGNTDYPASADGGVESFGSTLHWGVDWTQNRFELTHAVYQHPSKLSDDFHTYGLYWSQDRLYTYIDDPDNVVLDIDLAAERFFDKGKFTSNYEDPWRNSDNTNAPFDQEYYLIMNLAVGGTAGYFKDNVAGKPWSDKSNSAVNDFYAAKDRWFPTWNNPDVAMEIDSVKVWALNE